MLTTVDSYVGEADDSIEESVNEVWWEADTGISADIGKTRHLVDKGVDVKIITTSQVNANLVRDLPKKGWHLSKHNTCALQLPGPRLRREISILSRKPLKSTACDCPSQAIHSGVKRLSNTRTQQLVAALVTELMKQTDEQREEHATAPSLDATQCVPDSIQHPAEPVQVRPCVPSPSISLTTFDNAAQDSSEHIDLCDPITEETAASAFPTDAAERKRDAKRAAKAAGTELEVRKMKKHVETHYDDCGENLSSLGDDASDMPLLVFSDADSAEPEQVRPESSDDESTDAEDAAQLMELFAFYGADVDGLPPSPESVQIVPNVVEMFAVLDGQAKGTDVIEICGGENRIGRIAIRRRLKHGENFDLVTNYDLNDPDTQNRVLRYIQKEKPLVAVMSPTCKPFGPLGYFNEVAHYQAWLRSYEAAAPHGRFCGVVAKMQLRAGRHFLNEQPYPSRLYAEAPWPEVRTDDRVVSQVFDQCRTNQRAADGKLAKKPTELVASDEALLRPFRNLRCNGRHIHANTEGGASAALQVWSWDFAGRVVDGIRLLKIKIGRTRTGEAYPAVEADPEAPPVSCPGCRVNCRKTDPRHNRDPAVCRHPLVQSIEWDCVGCSAGKPRQHTSHDYMPGVCQWAAAQERRGHTRTRAHPRPPRRRASADPTAGLEGAPEDGELGADDEREAIAANDAVGNALDEPLTGGSSSSTAPARGTYKPKDPPGPMNGPPEKPRYSNWQDFDSGRSLRGLRHTSEAGKQRILRKLHLRWWHAGAATMNRLLQHADVPKETRDLLPAIVETCETCRTWSKPLNESVASVAISDKFNSQVEADLMFYKKYIILNLVDRCTRWHASRVIESKDMSTLINAIDEMWCSHHGPMTELIIDGERALAIGWESGIYFHNKSIKVIIRAPGQHARIVERRQALLRDSLHKIDTNLEKLKITDIPIQHRLSESTFAGNALVAINGCTPYNAVYGRVPALLPSLNSPSMDDGSMPGLTRNSHHLRDAAVSSMIEATARARIDRALSTKTISPAQVDYELGSEVDFFRPPSQKDLPGWSGPARVVDMSLVDRGTIKVEFRGPRACLLPERHEAIHRLPCVPRCSTPDEQHRTGDGMPAQVVRKHPSAKYPNHRMHQA